MNADIESKVSSLEIEQDFRLPAPLDPHVASLSIRTVSNNPNDHFDLRVSASFGKEVVLLDSGGEIIEVCLSIKKAEIKFNAVNADISHTEVQARESESWVGRQERTQARAASNSTDLAAAAGVDMQKVPKSFASVSAGGKVEAQSSHSESAHFDRALLPWRMLSEDTIQLGYLDDFDRELAGRIIDESVSIRARPKDQTKKVGVLARIRVREQWIEISDASLRKDSPKLQKYWAGLKRKDKIGEERRRLFQKLLAHLMLVELQDPNDRKNATIAAAALVLVPTSDAFVGIQSPKQRQTISIDPTAVENFLRSDPGDEMRVLRDLGVALDSETSSESAEAIIKNLEFLLAQSSSALIFRSRNSRYFTDLLSHSIGLDLEVRASTSLSSTDSDDFSKNQTTATVYFKSVKKLPKSIDEIVQGHPLHYDNVAAMLGMGIAVKGEQAYRFARSLGFTLSYQSFQKKISKWGYKSGYGYLLTYNDVA